MSNLSLPPEKLANLSPNELKGYNKWLQKEDTVPLSELLAERMYGSFIQGKTCEEIFRANSQYSFGAIVDARLRFNWDERRSLYFEHLAEEVEKRQITSHLGAIQFVSDLLAVAQITQTEKLNKYMVSRDPNDLVGVIPVDNVKDFKALIEVMMLLTGKSGGTPLVNVNVGGKAKDSIPAGTLSGDQTVSVTPESHSNFLDDAAKEVAAAAPVRRKRGE